MWFVWIGNRKYLSGLTWAATKKQCTASVSFELYSHSTFAAEPVAYWVPCTASRALIAILPPSYYKTERIQDLSDETNREN